MKALESIDWLQGVEAATIIAVAAKPGVSATALFVVGDRLDESRYRVWSGVA